MISARTSMYTTSYSGSNNVLWCLETFFTTAPSPPDISPLLNCAPSLCRVGIGAMHSVKPSMSFPYIPATENTRKLEQHSKMLLSKTRLSKLDNRKLCTRKFCTSKSIRQTRQSKPRQSKTLHVESLHMNPILGPYTWTLYLDLYLDPILEPHTRPLYMNLILGPHTQTQQQTVGCLTLLSHSFPSFLAFHPRHLHAYSHTRTQTRTRKRRLEYKQFEHKHSHTCTHLTIQTCTNTQCQRHRPRRLYIRYHHPRQLCNSCRRYQYPRTASTRAVEDIYPHDNFHNSYRRHQRTLRFP